MSYFVYILRCKDATLYTGITNNIEKRFAAHQKGVGARYTRAHPPESVVFKKRFRTKGAALKYEYKTKQLSRAAKLELIK